MPLSVEDALSIFGGEFSHINEDIIPKVTDTYWLGSATLGFKGLRSSAPIVLMPSGDTDDYFTFSTVADIPTITATGADRLNINSSVFFNGTYMLVGDNVYWSTVNADNNSFNFRARDNGIASVEVMRIQGAADPYVQIGRDDTGMATNAVTDVLVIQAGAGTNNEAAGFGSGIAFKLGNDASELENRARISTSLAVATNGAETSQMTFGIMKGGAAIATVFTLGQFGNESNTHFNVSGDFGFLTDNRGIYAANADGKYVTFNARDTGVGQVEIARFVGAADPYVIIGRDDTGVATNAVTDVLVIQAGAGTNNEAAGFGAGISFKLGNTASEVEERGSLDFYLSVATDGTESSQLLLRCATNGTVQDSMLFNNSGLFFKVDGQFIVAPNVDSNYFWFRARDNGVGLVEVGRVSNAADPFFQIGRDDTGVATNAVTDGLVLQMGAGSNNEAAGQGFGIRVKLGNAASEVETRVRLEFALRDATNGAEYSDINYYIQANGAEVMVAQMNFLGMALTSGLGYYIGATKVVGARVIDARIDDAINSGDATTDGVIDAIRDALIAHGLIAAS